MWNCLNAYFDEIFVITCPEFTDRHLFIDSQMRKFGIRYRFVIAPPKNLLKPTNEKPGLKPISLGEQSLILAHAACLQTAEISGFKSICIVEDDTKLHDLSAYAVGLAQFLGNLPPIWDCLYLGNPPWPLHVSPDKVAREPCSAYCDLVLGGSGSNFNAVSSRAYRPLIERLQRMEMPADFAYFAQFALRHSYCPPVFFADALSMPHEKYRSLIPNFNPANYFPSSLRDEASNP